MKLFYSYCSKDKAFRDEISKHLAPIRENKLVDDEWFDEKILPGSKWDDEIKAHLKSSDIILLLLSPDFLASSNCKEEADIALGLLEEKGVRVIPILVRPCAWKKHREIKKLEILPKNLTPVVCWDNQDTAFVKILEGVESVARDMKISIREEFRTKITEIEFISQKKDRIELDDVFVFPNIFHETDAHGVRVKSFAGLWDVGDFLVIKGDETSGKTTICRKLFFECVSRGTPVVMISGREITSSRHHEPLVEKKFNEQFRGNYERWRNMENKTLIVDDLNSSSKLEFLDFAKECFDRIFIAASEDEYLSYFKYEERLANHELLTLRPFNHSQQERLIRRWKSLESPGSELELINHGEIDQIEDRLNSIIHNNKILPRYPFFILSILQTYEGFMPQDMRITAYGHCYQALITAQLLKSGVQKDDVDSAFNFLTHLAYDMFNNKENYSEAHFREFMRKYKKRFVIKDSVVNRIRNGGIVSEDQYGKHHLSYPFVYYFFLGNFFAKNYHQNRSTVEQLAEKSYLRDNRYVLIFTIHHTHDDDLIETILLHTMTAMDHHSIAKLTSDETKPLLSALTEIPEKIISQRSVEKEREAERIQKDKAEAAERTYEKEHEIEEVNSLYKSLKNMEILGQILRNKYGSFPKDRLREIVTTIADAGLRIITLFTDDDGMRDLEDYLMSRARESDVDNSAKVEEDLRRWTRVFCFLMMATVIGRIVASIRKPELAEVVSDVCDNENTPAYDLIDFFFVLATAVEIRESDADKLRTLHRKFGEDKNEIAKRLLSIVTQDYLNKHNVPYKLRQKIFKALKIRYQPNPQLKA